MSNKNSTIPYIVFTNNLERRVLEHKAACGSFLHQNIIFLI